VTKKKFFLEPVSEELAPDYNSVIKQPMDFTTMQNKIEKYKYNNLDDFEIDVKLICGNAMLYNDEKTEYFTAARDLQNYAVSQINEHKEKFKMKIERGGGKLHDLPTSPGGTVYKGIKKRKTTLTEPVMREYSSFASLQNLPPLMPPGGGSFSPTAASTSTTTTTTSSTTVTPAATPTYEKTPRTKKQRTSNAANVKPIVEEMVDADYNLQLRKEFDAWAKKAFYNIENQVVPMEPNLVIEEIDR